MTDLCRDVHGMTVLVCGMDGPALRAERDANDLLSAAWAANATCVALPIERLEPEFFQLETRIAGEFAQKFVNYRMRLALIGDISLFLNQSKALRDFVSESNRGQSLWFAKDWSELESRLAIR
jgi:hypothetical protein